MFGKYPILKTSVVVVVLFCDKRGLGFAINETAITAAIIAPAIANFVFGFTIQYPILILLFLLA